RQMAVMPQLVNRGYDAIAGNKGSSIDVPIPSAITAQAVTPSNTPPSTADVSPTSVNIPLNQWKEAPFYLTDQDMLIAMNGTIPMQASEAIKAIANDVDNFILGLYVGVYGFAGTPGTTPFASDLSAFKDAMVALNKQLAPKRDRRVVLDPFAEGNAIIVHNFVQAEQRGDNAGILEGMIGHKLGADWYMDQNVQVHTAGVPGGTPVAASGQSAGQTNQVTGPQNGISNVGFLNITGCASLGTYAAGDIITIAGDAQTYAVLNAATANGAGAVTVNIAPALKQVPGTGSSAVTLKAAHTVNLHFHRDAFAFATRPLADSAEGLGNLITSAVDPVSGLTLRLEVSREHKRTRFSYDVLYGAALVRPELAARIAG
ncbi:MAG TPA: P22 phage major capsid protein family protein, partial [Gemmatimonadaceae bacterium]|nr:P22 phage major capsid protein family protein [Gemmatimonadaceae bacterium]